MTQRRIGTYITVFALSPREDIRESARAEGGVEGSWEHFEATLGSLPAVVPSLVYNWPVGEAIREDPTSEDATSGHPNAIVRRILTTFWTLARQDLTVEETERPHRALRRRVERQGVRRQQAEAPVRVVRLQHYFHDDSLPQQDAEVPEPAASDEKKRQYRHQWMVRGFWRNTWFPSLQAHRVQWIAPHVRGPKDKPLLGGEKVFLVRTPPGDVGAAPNDPDPRTD